MSRDRSTCCLVAAALLVTGLSGCRKPAAPNTAGADAVAADANRTDAPAPPAPLTPPVDQKWYVVEMDCAPVETTLEPLQPGLLTQLESGTSSDRIEVEKDVAKLRPTPGSTSTLVFVRGLDPCRNMSKLIR